jgi:hypothetical protein
MANTPRYYFSLGPVAQTPHSRYAVVAGDGVTVLSTQISVPDLVEIERPAVLRWRHEAAAVAVRTKIDYQQFVIHTHNGEQPRKPTWRRAGRRAAPTQT